MQDLSSATAPLVKLSAPPLAAIFGSVWWPAYCKRLPAGACARPAVIRSPSSSSLEPAPTLNTLDVPPPESVPFALRTVRLRPNGTSIV
eukprot:1543276-Prymnesium_polylepis.2